MKIKSLKNENLLDLIPYKLVESEKNEFGDVTILFPKFKNPFFSKLFVSKNKSPYIKIKLDSLGSAFWDECDGKQDVQEIGSKLKVKFGEKIEPIYNRLQIFIHQLRKGGYLDLKEREN